MLAVYGKTSSQTVGEREESMILQQLGIRLEKIKSDAHFISKNKVNYKWLQG